MNWKKADTKTVLLLWKIISLSSEQVTHNSRFYNITLWKSAVVLDPLRGFLAGNVLFYNNNTVFVSTFLHFMGFKISKGIELGRGLKKHNFEEISNQNKRLYLYNLHTFESPYFHTHTQTFFLIPGQMCWWLWWWSSTDIFSGSQR